ncbi:hypothetical protein Ahy_B02g058955 [Arachis hypogaea]|uniref:Protein FAR1-RELATED SEQUENCE n=1 Tax=Arachis hypogaea TaxID=3818 RepID=A0A445AFV0_ARAHY|nr:hypothetical protein Ahy_B02g058955 [Arachis hypogaea]
MKRYCGRVWVATKFVEELVADYRSVYGQPIVKSKLEALESYAATVYTKEVFELFREALLLASNVRVVSCKKLARVPCLRSPCTARIGLGVLLRTRRMTNLLACACIWNHLTFFLPVKTIYERWTKKAKQPATDPSRQVGEIPDVAYMSMHVALLND